MPLQTVSVTINSAAPYRVALQSPDSLLPEKTSSGIVLVYDRWNNPVTAPTKVKIQTIGDLQINGSTSSELTTDNTGIVPFVLNSGKI